VRVREAASRTRAGNWQVDEFTARELWRFANACGELAAWPSATRKKRAQTARLAFLEAG
jgi:hypothetical protein